MRVNVISPSPGSGRRLLWMALFVLALGPWAHAAHGGTFPPLRPGGKYTGPLDIGRLPAPKPQSPGPIAGQPGASPGPGPKPTSPRPASSPATLGAAVDANVWQLWWRFNRHPYLELKAHIHARSATSASDDFFLGQGQKGNLPALRPDAERINADIVPVLSRALREERSNDILTGSLIALAKIGANDEHAKGRVREFSMFLSHGSQEVAETAAIALGILAHPAAIADLVDLAHDTERGRKLVRSTEVSYRTRAFATYGLGLIAYATDDNATRQAIGEVLIDIIEAPAFSTRDIKAAAVTALGLTPIDLAPSIPPRDSGRERGENTLHVVSRRAQVAYLLERFAPTRSRARDRQYGVRAHLPTALARLAANASSDLKPRVVTDLIAAIESSKESQEIRQSCVLALGVLGDSDADEIDALIRTTLVSMIKDGQPQTRRFALIALAQTGGRRGTGDSPRAGLEEVRKQLMSTLARGKSQLKPWAGLALGVLGNALGSDGVAPDKEATLALRAQTADCRQPQDIGAYALGLGLRRDALSQELLIEKLELFSADDPRADVAVALGLLGERSSTEAIQEILVKSKYRPALLARASIGLALLADKSVVPTLVKGLKEANSASGQTSFALALGTIGDNRSLDPLIEMLDDEKLTDGARAFAAVALGIICDKEPRPWNSKVSTGINYRATTSTLLGESCGVLEIL